MMGSIQIAKKRIAAFAVAVLISGIAFARCAGADGASQRYWLPLSVSILPAVEFPPQDWNVYGISVNVFTGKHYDVGGFDVSLIATLVSDSLVGVQMSGIFARTDNTLTGCQISPVSFSGTLEGIQIGIFNRVEGLGGLQIGFVNYAYQATGIQFGLVNIIANSALSIMPIVNMGF